MLKLDLAFLHFFFCFSTYYFSLSIKQNAGQLIVVRDNQFNHTILRVNNGRDIENGKYPFAVVLFVFDKKYKFGVSRVCMASMITESWVITAAHCVDSLQDSESYVWYGNYTVPPSESHLFSLVLEKFIHPGYRFQDFGLLNAFILDNDISLIRVHPTSLPRYGRLSSVDHTTMIGLPVVYVGAGFTDQLGDDGTRLLQFGEGAVVTCDGKFRDMTRYLICVSPKCSNRLDRANNGDSGGPLLYEGRIIGVLSYGENVEAQVVSNGYTPVSPYIDWISEVTRQNNNV